jgi:hypothetical protein
MERSKAAEMLASRRRHRAPVYIFRTKHFPGSARISSRISSVSSAAVSCVIESFVVSASESI